MIRIYDKLEKHINNYRWGMDMVINYHKGPVWTYRYGEHTIVVKNAVETTLHVNGQLQDKVMGIMLQATLTGKLDSGEEIKVQIGGILNVECHLFIDNVLQTPI